MEVKIAQRMQFTTWIDSDKILRTRSGLVRFSRRVKEQERIKIFISAHLQHRSSNCHRQAKGEVSCSFNNFSASTLESGSVHAPYDEALVLKNLSQEIEPYLDGRSIYLVGMMGSGKTTVGKIISQVLGYSFSDSDTWVEQAVGGTSVAEIFKLYGEGFFRDKETEALRKLSLLHRLVVSTGGGAVTRPINWKYMQKGISVWLDVPLEALARRIADEGTRSRPLLDDNSDDAYRRTLKRLSTLLEERSEAYANANARVSLENIAAKMGYRDVMNLTPAIIAIESLEQIKGFLNSEDGMSISGF